MRELKQHSSLVVKFSPEMNSSIEHSVGIILDIEVWIVLQFIDTKAFESQTFLRFDATNSARLKRGTVLLNLFTKQIKLSNTFKTDLMFKVLILKIKA